jgi:hypothetical protein
METDIDVIGETIEAKVAERQCQFCKHWTGNKAKHPLEHQVVAQCDLELQAIQHHCDDTCENYEAAAA